MNCYQIYCRVSVITFASLLVSAGYVGAEQSISIDPSSINTYFADPVHGDALAVGAEAVIPIHIKNTDNQECFYLPCFAFEISDNGSGGTWTWPSRDASDALYGYEKLFLDTLCHPMVGCYPNWVYFDRGGDAYADGGHRLFSSVYRQFDYGGPDDPEGVGRDVIGIAGVAFGPLGLYYGMDNDALALKLTPNDTGSTICIDAAHDMEDYEWAWSPLAVDADAVPCAAVDVTPDWGGPYCFSVLPACPTPPLFSECDEEGKNPTDLEASYCETLTADFCVGSGSTPGATYSVNYGLIDSSGHWSWTPEDAGLIGTPIILIVEVWGASCGYEVHNVAVNLRNELPWITNCPEDPIVAVMLSEMVIPFEAIVDCPGEPLTFFVVGDGGASGTYFFEGAELHCVPGLEDSLVEVEVGVTDGLDTTRACVVELNCFRGCCMAFGGGFTGNVDCSRDLKLTLADVARLIDHVFISKGALCCAELGDTNGSGTQDITLADITRLIDHIYFSKDPTEPCP